MTQDGQTSPTTRSWSSKWWNTFLVRHGRIIFCFSPELHYSYLQPKNTGLSLASTSTPQKATTPILSSTATQNCKGDSCELCNRDHWCMLLHLPIYQMLELTLVSCLRAHEVVDLKFLNIRGNSNSSCYSSSCLSHLLHSVHGNQPLSYLLLFSLLIFSSFFSPIHHSLPFHFISSSSFKLLCYPLSKQTFPIV